jgi:hypothetical protein
MSRLRTPVPTLRMVKSKAKDKRKPVVDLVSPEKPGSGKQASSLRVLM